MDFAQAVIKQRNLKGLTQEGLAELSGVSLRTIQRIESGTVSPRLSTKKLIEEVLELPIETKKKPWKLWGIALLILVGIAVAVTALFKSQKEPLVLQGVTGFSVKGSLIEVREFDWEETRDLFEANDPDLEIFIGFEVDEPVYLNGRPFNNFQFDVKGKTEDYDDLVTQYKTTVNKLKTKDENTNSKLDSSFEPE